MVNFYIVNTLGQILATSESCNCCKRSKFVISGDLSKNGYVWATLWPTFIELKIKFDPSSWPEFFRNEKSWSKNIHPRGVIWVGPGMVAWQKKRWRLSCPVYEDSHGLDMEMKISPSNNCGLSTNNVSGGKVSFYVGQIISKILLNQKDAWFISSVDLI